MKKISSFLILTLAILWFVPLYFMIINSFKTFKEVIMETAAFPSKFYLGNFIEIFEKTNYGQLFMNSLIVLAISLFFILLFGAMAAYFIVREKTVFGKILLFFFIITMIVPFQSIMIPLLRTLNQFGLIDRLAGVILVYIAQLTPMSIFLYYGSMKTIPLSLEESARMDGATPYQIFFRIILPLMHPITATLAILHTLWIWNDFLLPLIVLQSPEKKTLSLGTYALFIGQYSNKMNLGMTAVFLASIPMLLIYILMQKYIVKGIMKGAIKG